MTREELIAEVEHLKGTDTGNGIATRLGYTRRASLERALERAGRKDLAAVVRL